MSTDRGRWLAFVEEAVGFLTLAVVAVVRSASPDRWATFALLVGAYVVALCGASAALERRLPFGSRPLGADAPGGINGRGAAGLELVGAGVAFAALTVAFDRHALSPSVQWIGLAVVAAAAWTMGHGLAGAVGLLGLNRRAGHSTDVGQRTNPL